jgi:ketosteroid isomerase-like protein
MSHENVELVRRAFQAFNDRDFDFLAASRTDDVVLRQIGGFADLTGAEFRGPDAREWLRDWIDTIGGQVEVETILEAKDQVVAIMKIEGTGSSSGAPATMRVGQVFSFRDGRISAIDSITRPTKLSKRWACRSSRSCGGSGSGRPCSN